MIWPPYARIKPLYISKNQSTPDAPANEPHLRQRQRDAALAAWERANTIYHHHTEAWQHTLDQGHMEVYRREAARLEKIYYKDPQHYLHEKPIRHAGHTTKQYKKRLILQDHWQTPVEAAQKWLPMPHMPNKGPPRSHRKNH